MGKVNPRTPKHPFKDPSRQVRHPAGGQDHFTQASFGECNCPQTDIWVNGSSDPELQGEYNAVRFTKARRVAVASFPCGQRLINICALQAAVDIIESNDPTTQPLFLYVALQVLFRSCFHSGRVL